MTETSSVVGSGFAGSAYMPVAANVAPALEQTAPAIGQPVSALEATSGWQSPVTPVPGAGPFRYPSYATFTKQLGPLPYSAQHPDSFNRAWNKDGPGWTSADATYSVPLGDGRVLWLYGDSWINTRNWDGSIRSNGKFIRNSAVVQSGNTLTTLTRGVDWNPDDFMKPTQPGQWYWPFAGKVVGDRVYVFMNRVKSWGSGSWNFKSAGVDLLVLRKSDLSLVSRKEVGHGKVSWGVNMLDAGDHTYIYGMEDRKEVRNAAGAVVQQPGQFAYVARARQGDIGGSWEFWTGDHWSPNREAAKPVKSGVSPSFSVVKAGDGYALVSQEGFFSTRILCANSRSPMGPWSDWRVIHNGPSKAPGQLSYNALIHPEFNRNGQMLISWNMNGNRTSANASNNWIDRPVFGSISQDRLRR